VGQHSRSSTTPGVVSKGRKPHLQNLASAGRQHWTASAALHTNPWILRMLCCVVLCCVVLCCVVLCCVVLIPHICVISGIFPFVLRRVVLCCVVLCCVVLCCVVLCCVVLFVLVSKIRTIIYSRITLSGTSKAQLNSPAESKIRLHHREWPKQISRLAQFPSTRSRSKKFDSPSRHPTLE
jgi:hypothetical protein